MSKDIAIDTDYTDPGHQVKASCTAAAHLNAKLSAGHCSVTLNLSRCEVRCMLVAECMSQLT
jgi:hypothetical protein